MRPATTHVRPCGAAPEFCRATLQRCGQGRGQGGLAWVGPGERVLSRIHRSGADVRTHTSTAVDGSLRVISIGSRRGPPSHRQRDEGHVQEGDGYDC